jgi:BCCT family betaine/carnitine transporter
LSVAAVLAGMDKGVKRLSEVNMILALVLLGFVIIVGPTADILQGIFTGAGNYLANVVPLSNWVGREDTDFMHGWTTLASFW